MGRHSSGEFALESGLKGTSLGVRSHSETARKLSSVPQVYDDVLEHLGVRLEVPGGRST